MHPRRLARESILGALYAFELTGEEQSKVLSDLFDRNSFDEETKSYISDPVSYTHLTLPTNRIV